MRRIYTNLYAIILGLAIASAAAAQPASPYLRTGIQSRERSPHIQTSSAEAPAARVETRHDSTAEQKNLLEADGIREVIVDASETTVVLTFAARTDASPVVEFSGRRPTRGLGGQLEFPARYGVTLAKPNHRRRIFVRPTYSAEFSGLDPGTRYFYIITVPGSGTTGTRQLQGEFTTK